MPASRSPAVPIAAMCLALAVPMAAAQQATEPGPDPDRGKAVFRSKGLCVNCHGWPADGKTGVDLRAPTGPSLRETALDVDGLVEVIRCGRPGTQMPFHDRAAYRDDRCYGMVMADFGATGKPVRGRSLSEDEIRDLVAYLQAHVVGRGKPTQKECIEFFDNPAAKACLNLK